MLELSEHKRSQFSDNYWYVLQTVPLWLAFNTQPMEPPMLVFFSDKEVLMIFLFEHEVEKFWSKAGILGDDDCWEWVGLKSGGQRLGGYGIFPISRKHGIKSRNFYSHRLSYCLARGWPIDYLVRETEIRHMCNNHMCCNPHHLEIGTHAQNVQDIVDAGRIARGEKIGNSKLTEQEVLAIKKLLVKCVPYREIADHFNISKSTIWKIDKEKIWSWVTIDTQATEMVELSNDVEY